MADENKTAERGSSPVGRGAAGAYIEGELGAFYLLTMLAGSEPRGLPGSRVERVTFQGADQGFALDDLVIHGVTSTGSSILEIQSKRTISFAPKDGVFAEVCAQIAKSLASPVSANPHLLAVATQRTSFAISGAYQDVLEWARKAENGPDFFTRLALKGVASKPMREFVETFRANLVANGIADDDAAIWTILRRFLILEFDFEASAPLSRSHGLLLARQVLADGATRGAEALWSVLIELTLATGKSGGSLDRAGLRAILLQRDFQLAGDRDFAGSRARLAEMAQFALKTIGTTIATVSLPRLGVMEALDAARDMHRFVELQGGPGVGKSGVLRHLAERVARESHIIVLDPIGTPDGGWSGFAQHLGVTSTARTFLEDLAASGGGVIFIDGLEMFASPEKQRTVNDLLRQASEIEGFSVVCTSRAGFGREGDHWIAGDALKAFGGSQSILMSELEESEIEMLREQAPGLRALLAPDHPAAGIARNLYRLSRLLKLPAAATIRTEAALADYWWRSGDGAELAHVRETQRLLADLADASLGGMEPLEVRTDSYARTHLLRTNALREARRDNLAFYHDVLRDWSIAERVREDPALIAKLPLSGLASPRLARGIEFAGRLALELSDGPDGWLALLERLSGKDIHPSWRRHALLAIVRSERALELLDQCSGALLAQGGALLRELSATVVAVETVSMADYAGQVRAQAGAVENVAVAEQAESASKLPRHVRTATTAAPAHILKWAMEHHDVLPLQVITAVLDLVEIVLPVVKMAPRFANPVAELLFSWLRQLDVDAATSAIPNPEDAPPLRGQAFSRMVRELRKFALALAEFAPESAMAYLRAITTERDYHKVKEIRPFSAALATVAPDELAALIEASLIEPEERGRSRHNRYKAFSHQDTDFMPASPAQPPFLDLLESEPSVGLDLIRRLVEAAVRYYANADGPGANGFTLVFEGGSRFFPWVDTYFWSRDQAREYSVGSSLKALEAWGHGRIEAGDRVKDVLADILGPPGSCAAFLLVAVDLLISHWPATREAAVPFIGSPELLATERGRQGHDQMGGYGFALNNEPMGRIRLADLRDRPSRGVPLERLLIGYLGEDEIAEAVRARLRDAIAKLSPYQEHDDFGDPAFMGAYALNLLDPKNWQPVEGGKAYQSPPDEAAHLARQGALLADRLRANEIEAKIHLALDDPTKSSAELARAAIDYAGGDLPDDSDPDSLKARSTRLITTALLAARDGEESLIREHEAWIRDVIARGLAEDASRGSGSSEMLRFNRPALATSALIHLWCRFGASSDRTAILNMAVRGDEAAIPAFAAASSAIVERDERLLIAATRAAFQAARWRWKPYDEEPSIDEAWRRGKDATDQRRVEVESAWLDGGAEPDWPAFPDEKPVLRRSFRIPSPARRSRPAPIEADDDAVDNRAWIHVNSQAAAQWLRILSASSAMDAACRQRIVDTYAAWSARLNGFGYGAEVEIDRVPDDWNLQFYDLVAKALMEAPGEMFEGLLAPIVALPDQAFCDVGQTILHTSDVWYFNSDVRAADRPVELRRALVARTMALRRWDRDPRPGDLSIDHDTGALVAKLLLNTYDFIDKTKTYLVPAKFDRIDPLLATWVPMQSGGPTNFIALCMMNTLLLVPRARHLEFMLGATEAWLERFPAEKAIWQDLGIGRRIMEWLDAVAIADASLLGPAHPYRARIDALLGCLVNLGVPEAHDMEQQILVIAATAAE